MSSKEQVHYSLFSSAQMSSKFVLLLLSTLLSLIVSAGTSQVEKTNPGPSSNVSASMFQVETTNPKPQFHNWLVQTWPTGYCYARRDCKKNLPSEFTIHGLWPVDFNGEGLHIPFDRDMKRHGICKMIQQHPETVRFSANMVRYWPSLMFNFNVDLWVNEWNEHGIFQNSLGPTAYFNNSIRVAQGVDLKKTLAEEKIVPRNSEPYPIESYITAITKKTNGHPLLLCNPTRYDGLPVLAEVVICVDEMAEHVVPCIVNPDYPRLCPEENIWFLESVPNSANPEVGQQKVSALLKIKLYLHSASQPPFQQHHTKF